MKKLLLSLLFTPVFFSAVGQSWATPGATWYYDFSNMSLEGYTKIWKAGDTIINGKLCDILKKQTWYHDWSGGGNMSWMLPDAYTYIDSNIVYHYSFGQFNVLYDFNAVVGSNWLIRGSDYWVSPTCSNFDTLQVDSIGTTIINSDTLKYLRVSQNSAPYWACCWFDNLIIEKIGALGYMFPEPNCTVDAVEGGLFRCYTDSSGWSYQTIIPPLYCDYWPSGINEVSNNFSFTLSPNPTNGMFEVRCPMTDAGRLEISDILGEKVYSASVIGRQASVNLSSQPKGIYFVKVLNQEGQWAVRKVVIQ